MIKAERISKSFSSPLSRYERLQVIDNLSLSIAEGELVTLFGPNGCGKTTLLNLFAGIISPDSGQIDWGGNNAHRKEIGFVFQNYADTLLPWRTVEGNIAFSLEVRGVNADDIAHKTRKVMDMFKLREHADKYIYELSGGLKQLVSIARSTVYNPRLLLLDEPFSALDYSTSRMLWERFREFWARTNETTLFVSHNVDEAVFLGDRVCVVSSRPARIVAEIPVPFGNDRSLDILESQAFFNVRTQVLKAFEEGGNS